MKTQTKGKIDVDMSPRAVAGRLDEVGALYKLGVSLMSIRVDQGKPVVSRSK